MSTPHDPWSAGPPASDPAEPTPDAVPEEANPSGSEPSGPASPADPDDRTTMRSTDGTYTRSPWPDAPSPDASSTNDSPDANATQVRPVQSRDPGANEPQPWSAPAQPGPYSAPPSGYSQPGTAQPGYAQPGTNQPGYAQPGANQPGSGQPGGYSPPSSAQPGPNQPGPYGQPGYNQTQPGTSPPGYGAPQPAYPQSYPQPGYSQPSVGYQGPATPGQPARRNRKRPLIIGLCAVLVLALATVGFLVLRPSSSPAFTFASKKIANADAVLTTAQTNTAALVKSRHGASNADTRCYFARATKPSKGTKKSDIDAHAYCGPVLFVDGDKAKTYLSFPISQTGTKSGAVTLAAGSTPTAAEPQSAPAGMTLGRPDKIAPKAANLALPTPPPAAAGVFSTTADVSDSTIPSAPADAVIGSRTGGVSITSLGTVLRYGHGDDARSAPTGQKLIAFKTAAGPDEDGFLRFPDGTIAVAVGGQSHSVPKTATTVVVAVPDSASAADLVVTDAGATQRVSLLTGRPAATNIAVDRRRHHGGNLGGPKVVTFTVSAGPDKVTRKARASMLGSDLRYWVRTGDNRHASSPSTALLYVDLEYSYTEAIKRPFTAASSFGPYGFDTSLLKLRLPGGKLVAARNYATEADKLYILFPVPASFTSGTVVISGHEPPNKNGVTLGISGSTTFSVQIAAG